jgi:hypothetical protein
MSRPRRYLRLAPQAHRALGVLLALAAIAGGLGACSEEEAVLPNQPPQTFLAVEGAELAPTHYRQILSWHGEDADGEVVRYEYQWRLDPATPPVDFDTTWVGLAAPFVTATRDTFFLPVPTSGADTLTHRFRVRAVDDKGLADPVPADLAVPVFNRAPHLWAITSAGDTTSTLVLPASILPVLTIRFKVGDPDNHAADPEEALAYIESVRFWFEDPADAITVAGTDTLINLEPPDFGQLVGIDREFHLQARDLGGAESNVLSATAFVRDIRQARVLLIDGAAQASPQNITVIDPFWHGAFIDSLFAAPGEVLLHDIGASGPIGAPENLHAIFSLFEAVVWYNGTDGAPLAFTNLPSPTLQAAEAGLRAYLDAGGKVLLEGYNLVGASRGSYSGGSFSVDFEHTVLMADSLAAHETGTGGAQTSNFWVFGPKQFQGFPAAGTEALGLAPGVQLKGVDRMVLDPEALSTGIVQELYRIGGEQTYPPSPIAGAVGVRRRFESGGQLVLLTYPISLTWANDNVLAQVRGFMTEFGVLP